MGNGLTIKWKVKEYIGINLVLLILDHGKIICIMAMANINSRIIAYMKDNGMSIKCMGRVFFTIRRVHNGLENLLMEYINLKCKNN
jgi:hypothetical protein